MFLRKLVIGCGIAVGVITAGGFAAAPAYAEPITGTIFGSGIGANPSSSVGRDSNWKIVALPAGYTPPDGQSIGYDAYVPQNVASPWLGSGNSIGGGLSGPQTGYTTGGTTYYWIAPAPSVTELSLALAPVDVNIPTTWYKWIAAQTFTIPSAGNYYLNFPSAVDNRLDYFVNGTIDTTNSRQPTITGGFQITTTNTATGQFLSISNNTNAAPIFLAAGTHTAYMVLTDLGNATGVLIGPSVFSTVPVPEPSALVLATIGASALAWLGYSRRTLTHARSEARRRTSA